MFDCTRKYLFDVRIYEYFNSAKKNLIGTKFMLNLENQNISSYCRVVFLRHVHRWWIRKKGALGTPILIAKEIERIILSCESSFTLFGPLSYVKKGFLW